MSLQPENLLIIKHGALGDIILATGHIKSIDKAHSMLKVYCLTSKTYAALLSECPWIDEVWIDPKPRFFQPLGWLKLIKLLRSKRFRWVYDLQTSDRSSSYWWLVRWPTKWSGIAIFASHKQVHKDRHTMHTIDRLTHQLELTNLYPDPTPDISWLTGDVDSILQFIHRSLLTQTDYAAHVGKLIQGVPPFALIVPGGSAHRPEKRWPVEHYIALAKQLRDNGVAPVLIGTKSESELLARIESEVRGAVNLCDRTSFGQLASLARLARWGVGNDTGPMHIIAAVNCPVSVIFSAASNPKKSAPRGSHVHVLQKDDLQSLSTTTVWNSHPLSLTVRPEALA